MAPCSFSKFLGATLDFSLFLHSLWPNLLYYQSPLVELPRSISTSPPQNSLVRLVVTTFGHNTFLLHHQSPLHCILPTAQQMCSHVFPLKAKQKLSLGWMTAIVPAFCLYSSPLQPVFHVAAIMPTMNFMNVSINRNLVASLSCWKPFPLFTIGKKTNKQKIKNKNKNYLILLYK